MTPQRLARAAVLSLLLATAPAAATVPPPPTPEPERPPKPHPGFDLLQSLVGTWEMPAQGETPATTITFTLVSGGTALLETMAIAQQRDAMVTLYHRDGDRLLLTHYCGVGNQPRMRCAKPAAGGRSLAFEFVDGANMKASDGHMHRMVLTLEGDDRLTEQWTWKKGKTEHQETFRFTRKHS